MIKFEQMSPPYDKYSVTNEGHVMDIDTGIYVHEEIDYKSGKQYVVLHGSHKKSRKFFIAPMVAEMFVQNKHNLGYVYYKDGNVQNNHADNLGYAINPKEAQQRVARPHRLEVEDERHELIIKINNACDKKDYREANRLGKILWELEGSSYNDRYEEVWLWHSLYRK